MENFDVNAQLNDLVRKLGRIAKDETLRTMNKPWPVSGTAMHPYSKATIRFDTTSKEFVISHADQEVRVSEVNQALSILLGAWMHDLMNLGDTERLR